MADYTTKRGESLANMKVGFIGRDGSAVDLTSAAVTVNIRHYAESTNAVNEGVCSIVPPATDGVVRGPVGGLDTPGGYQAVFKVTGLANGPHEFPSSGSYRIEVEDDLEDLD